MMIRVMLIVFLIVIHIYPSDVWGQASHFEIFSKTKGAVCIAETAAPEPVQTALRHFAEDIQQVTGNMPHIKQKPAKGDELIIIAGTIDHSPLIRQLIANGKLKPGSKANAWEGFQINVVTAPFHGIRKALVITGRHARGVAYGLFHLSEQFGVSPWYWWADVPVKTKDAIFLPEGYFYEDAPLIKYRGIFINDEAPALSNWAKEKFGGFNARFYQKVFELMLRLRANYIWPAMWGSAFFDDDTLNAATANAYGIVIGTSHHEPLMRAHDEWRRYGQGKWNYDSNAAVLRSFWKQGLHRANTEKIITIGMRGDGDEPMSRETAISLLERIVQDQRKIIAEVSGNTAEATPQLWALYKEVQDYYDKGMRVPDDVTLLLCDDNWGNIRRLPLLHEKQRKGGYGIYYHFDYVGGPRNYKWINTNHIARIWEQMHAAWQYKVRQIWIVNVGDIKPMEFPISFFLDYAWNPTRMGAADLMSYTSSWVAKQFGKTHAAEISTFLNTYTKYNSRRKPELLDANTFSFNYGEWDSVVADWDALLHKAESVGNNIPEIYKPSYYQLILHPIQASANLNRLYYHTAINRRLAAQGDTTANIHGLLARNCFYRDSLITVNFHQLNNGKWNHMMSQTHIGYTYWQQPPVNVMPYTAFVARYNQSIYTAAVTDVYKETPLPTIANSSTSHVFYERNQMASMLAPHFTRKGELPGIRWEVLPEHGLDGDGITTMPVTHTVQTPGKGPWLEYDVYNISTDSIKIIWHFSPTLNFLNAPHGFQFEVMVNNDKPQIISMNEFDYDTRVWETWVANNRIKLTSRHAIDAGGKQTIRYSPLYPGMVLQKIEIDFGGLLPTYLGAPETRFQNK